MEDGILYYGYGDLTRQHQVEDIDLIPVTLDNPLPDYPSGIVPAHVADGGIVLSWLVPRSLCDNPLLLDVPEPVM